MLKISESAIIGFDYNEGEDEAVLIVMNYMSFADAHNKYVNVFVGAEAKDLYEKLTKKMLEKENTA
jgi:hypothetical protein